MGLWLLLRGNNRLAVFFQNRNVVCDDLPSGLGVNGAVAVRHNISHGFDLPPWNARVLLPEIVRQLADQLPDLQDTESRCITIDRIILEDHSVISKPLYCLFDLLTVGNDMLQYADIAVKRLRKAVPRYHE